MTIQTESRIFIIYLSCMVVSFSSRTERLTLIEEKIGNSPPNFNDGKTNVCLNTKLTNRNL